MQLEDLSGAVDLMVFTTQYERLAEQLVEDRAVLVRGQALPEEGGPAKVSAQEIVPLELAHVPMPSLISIRVGVDREGRADQLRRLFERKPGETDVRLRLERPRDFLVVLDTGFKVRPDREFRAEVDRICGPEAIEVLAG